MALTKEQFAKINSKLRFKTGEISHSVYDKKIAEVQNITKEEEEGLPENTLTPPPQSRFNNLQGIFSRTISGEQSAPEALYQTAAQGVGFAGDLLFEGAKGLFNLYVKGLSATTGGRQSEEKIKSELSAPFRAVAETKAGQSGLQALGEGMEKYESWKAENQRAAANIEATLLFGDLLLATKGLKIGGKIAKETGEEILEQGVKETVQQAGQKVSKLEQRLQPKLTKRVEEGLFKKGQVEQGKESLLFGKKPDVITPSEKITRVANLIEDEIPNANKLNNFELGNQINDLITSRAKKLTPEMKKVNFTPDDYKAINTNWNKLKNTSQNIMNYDALGGKAVTKKFDEIISKLNKPYKDKGGKFRQRTMNDVWEARKEFDTAVGKTVRNATDQASDLAQFQNSLWHDYRTLLNDLMTKKEAGLGKNARNSFRDMSSLYEALGNLAQTTKIDVKGSSGFLRSKVLPAAGIYGGAKLFEGVTGKNIPYL